MQSISIRQTSTKYTHSPRDSLPSQSTTTDQVNSHKRLIDLLEQSSPNNRDHETTRDISDQLLQLQFFQHIPRSDVENLAQQVQYRHMREHQTILRENDDGKAFYVIFHGRACVFKLDRPILTASDDNAEDNNTGDNGEEKTTSDTEQDMDRVSATTPTATKGVGSKWLRENNKRAAKEDELQLQHNHGGFITALTKDDTFGEVSLVKSLHQKGSRKRMKKHHKLRTATVVATSMAGCDVIVIHYEDFRKFVSPHGTGAEFYAWKRCRDILHVPKQARSAVEIGLLCNFVVTSKITFFAQLSGPLRRKVCQCAVLRTMNANETIFSEGKEGKEFFIILNGEVIVVKKNDDDASTEKVVARLCKGDAFGEQALLSGQPRTATTKAYENGPIELMVISEQDYHTVLEPLMSWSKNRFAQSTLLATNVSTSLKILNIPPSKRNATHIAQLRFFLDQLPFFKQLPGKLVDRMCHVVSLRKGDRHDCMCHQGDRGDEFFVILKGSVSVHIIKDEDKKNIVTARRRWQQNQQKHNIGGGGAGRSFGRSFVAGDAGDAGEAGGNQQKRAKHNAKHNANPNNTTNNTDNNKFQELVDEFDRKRESTPTSAKTKKKQWEKESRKRRGNGAESSDNEERGGDHIDDLLEDHGEAVATLLSGDSFGEMSLVSNHPRFATVICREKSMFMIISKEDYLAIASIGLVFDPSQCRDLLNKIPIKRTPSEIERMVQFVKPIPFFSQLDRNVCRKLCVCMTKIKAKQRNVVVLQGDEVDNHGGCFYILLKGSVSIHVAEHRVAPDPTGLKILMDRRPKDGHAHKEGYFSHVDHQGQHQGQHGGHVGTVSPQKAGYAATGHQVHELHRDAHQQMLAPLALETPIPLHRINEVDRVLGKCVTLLRAGDSFGELGLHDHHDHDGLSHENDKTALHIMQAGKEDTAATTTHSSHHRRHTTNSPHVGSSMGGSMGGGSPVKLTKQEKTLLLEQQMVGRRNASIVCREDCELLIVRRKDFLDVLSQQQIHFNPALARDIMNKSINNRSASDLSVLVQLCESLSFFSQFPTHLIQKCCKCLVLENYDPGDVIFEQGAKGDAFYIVLRGYLELDISSGCTLDESSSSDHHEPMSVAHAERVSMEMENEEILFRRHLSSKVLSKWKQQINRWKKRAQRSIEQSQLLGETPVASMSSSASSTSSAKERKNQKKKGTKELSMLHVHLNGSQKGEQLSRVASTWSGTKIGRKSYGSAICIFKTGDSFGETALVTSKPRGGTVLCIRERTELLKLSKHDFNEILKGMSDKVDFQASATRDIIIRAKKQNFDMLGSVQVIRNIVRGIPEFDRMDSTELNRLLERLSVRYYEEGDYIFNQYESSKECYMLIDGSVQFRHNNETLYEMKGKGRSFGMMGLLEQTSRSMAVTCNHDNGAICLVIDSKLYHDTWKNKMDRSFSAIVATLKKSKTLGNRIDMKELTLVASFAVPIALPRGAVLAYPDGTSGTSGSDPEDVRNHSVLLVIQGECELRPLSKTKKRLGDTTNGANGGANGGGASMNNTFSRPSSHARRPVSARTRGIMNNTASSRHPSQVEEQRNAASLIGPGMIVGDVFSSSSSSASATASYTLKCTRSTVLVRLRTHHLHRCLKSDTLRYLHLSTNSHLTFLQRQRTTMQKVKQDTTKQHQQQSIYHKSNIPGMSDKERLQHELELRSEKFAQEARKVHEAVVLMSGGRNSPANGGGGGGQQSRSNSPMFGESTEERQLLQDGEQEEADQQKELFDSLRRSSSRNSGDHRAGGYTARPAYNIFANTDASVVAMHVMHKVNSMLNKNIDGSSKRNQINNNNNNFNNFNSNNLATSPLRATQTSSVPPKQPHHHRPRPPPAASIKDRFQKLKISIDHAEKFHQEIDKKQKQTARRYQSVDSEVHSVLQRGLGLNETRQGYRIPSSRKNKRNNNSSSNQGTPLYGVSELPSEMTPMRTRRLQETGGKGKLLSIGSKRSNYLRTIFAQLSGTKGAESITADSNGRTSSAGTSGNRSRKRRRKKSAKKKKTIKVVQHAIHRREENRKDRILAQPTQMFDSLNYNKFV